MYARAHPPTTHMIWTLCPVDVAQEFVLELGLDETRKLGIGIYE